MHAQYTPQILQQWVNTLAADVKAGKLIVRPSMLVTHLNQQAVDALCSLLSYHHGIHTVEISPRFANSISGCLPYLYSALGQVAVVTGNANCYLFKLNLSYLNLTDNDIVALTAVLPQGFFDNVTLVGNSFSRIGFNALAKTIIANEVETKFWVGSYLLNPSTIERTNRQATALHNASQVMSYLFMQRLPYDLYKNILQKFYQSLEQNNWLQYVKPDSRLDVLFPPQKLDKNIDKLIAWLHQHHPDSLTELPLAEIKRIIVSEPLCLAQTDKMKDYNLFTSLWHNINLSLPTVDINHEFSLYSENHFLESHSSFLECHNNIVKVDFNGYKYHRNKIRFFTKPAKVFYLSDYIRKK